MAFFREKSEEFLRARDMQYICCDALLPQTGVVPPRPLQAPSHL